MAIESLYWKEELARIAKTFHPVAKPKRWSERAVCTVERDVVIGFFIVRRMIELHKVSAHIADMKLDVFGMPAIKIITKLNRFSLDKNYDWSAERAEEKPALYICNQCIHAYLSHVDRGPDRNWLNFFVVSDFDRNATIWRIPFATIIGLFEAASKDWPSEIRWIFDHRTQEYRVTTD